MDRRVDGDGDGDGDGAGLARRPIEHVLELIRVVEDVVALGEVAELIRRAQRPRLDLRGRREAKDAQSRRLHRAQRGVLLGTTTVRRAVTWKSCTSLCLMPREAAAME